MVAVFRNLRGWCRGVPYVGRASRVIGWGPSARPREVAFLRSLTDPARSIRRTGGVVLVTANSAKEYGLMSNIDHPEMS